jgi:OFA family oxalate/formate antiporter-like MFS transporter
MRKTGPWPIPMLAAALYGGGTALAGLSHDLVLPYLAYGVIGGAGLRLAYIVSWRLDSLSPDNRGMITGLAVAGFGAGALLTAPIAESLICVKCPARRP